MVRVAVIDKKSCRPKDCGHPCRKSCPVVRTGQDAIYFLDENLPPTIDEAICIGCGICVRKCPFNAIYIVNLPDQLEKEAFHRYGQNGFKLYRFPEIKPQSVNVIIGQNGMGKSTIAKILSGELIPNLGDPNSKPPIEQVIDRLKGTTSSEILENIFKKKFTVAFKPQHVELLPSVFVGSVKEALSKYEGSRYYGEVVNSMKLSTLFELKLNQLSGGELQKLAIALALLKDTDIIVLDEPASYLDVLQRLLVSRLLFSFKDKGKTLIVIEHDLGMIDYLADYVSIIYGEPGAYGIVSRLLSARVGINSYLNGFLKAENTQIRPFEIKFESRPPPEKRDLSVAFKWVKDEFKLNGFTLTIEGGEAYRGEVIGIVGQNGIGKTTFVRRIVESYFGVESQQISYKPQLITNLFKGKTVKEVLEEKFGSSNFPSWIETELLKPLRLNKLMERSTETLSGGELQALAVASSLISNSNFYFIDEPCSFLDVEQRVTVQRMIRRLTEIKAATTFVVEHDILFIDFVSDRLIVVDGEPGVHGYVSSPKSMKDGMNEFLSKLSITFRRDVDTNRPRINKPGSRTDLEQKQLGQYYYT
jgi:ATP-binding cassette subfamily E protein 1